MKNLSDIVSVNWQDLQPLFGRALHAITLIKCSFSVVFLLKIITGLFDTLYNSYFKITSVLNKSVLYERYRRVTFNSFLY